MSLERTEAIVLRGVDFTESSRIVTLICPQRGRVACLAAGARRAKSPLAAILDTFNRVEVTYYWKDKREVQRLSEAHLLHGYPGIKGDLWKAIYSAFPLEIVYRVVQKNEPSELIYKVLLQGLDSMDVWQGAPAAHAAWQVLQLISAAGFAPSIYDMEGDCGFDFSTGITQDIRRFDRIVSRDLLKDLQNLSVAGQHCPDLVYPDEVFDLLRGFVTRQIEADFRSLRVLDQMLRKNELRDGGVQ